MALSTRLLLLALACALFNIALAQGLYVNTAAGSLKEMTNAERLAKGLPLKKPQFTRRGGEGRLKPSIVYTTNTAPTSSISAVVPTPTSGSGNGVSNGGCAQVSGTIKVVSKDSSLNGYVSSPNEEGLYGYTADASSAAKFKYSSCASSPFSVTGESTESGGTSFDLFGAVQDSRSGCFLIGSVPETAGPKTLPNPLAEVLGLSSSEVSSSIWSINSGALTAHLVQVGSAASPVTPITYNTGTGLFAFNEDGKCSGTNATFTFVST